MIKKLFFTCVILCNLIFASEISLSLEKDKWNFIGTSQDINLEQIGLTTDDKVWYFNDGVWYTNRNYAEYSTITDLKANNGFWVYPSIDKTITIQKNKNQFMTQTNAWSMISSSGDMILSNDLDTSNNLVAWKYTDKWELWDPNSIFIQNSYTKFTTLSEGEGAWIFSKNNYKLPLVKKSTDDIEDIWNITIPVDTTKSFTSFNIGVKFVKYENDGTNDIGEFVYKGLSFSNNKLLSPSMLLINGTGDSGAGSTYFYSGYNPDNILEKSISFDGNNFLLNLGLIMKSQNMVKESTFKVVANYDISITSNVEIINENDNISFKLINDKYDFTNTKGLVGEIKIK